MLLVPFLVGLMILAKPGTTVVFDAVAGECRVWQAPAIFEWVTVGLVAATAVVLTFRLRVARVQVPHMVDD